MLEEEKFYKTLLAVREGDAKELEYVTICPKKMGKINIGSCKGCKNKMAYGTEQKEVRSPSGARAFESVPAVYCDYPLEMPEDKRKKFEEIYDAFKEGKPKEMPHDPDEFDAIVEECLSHIPADKRKP